MTLAKLVTLGLFAIGATASSANAFDCEKPSAEEVLCLSVPPDAPEKSLSVTPGSSTKPSGLVTSHDLSGAALSLENEFIADESMSPANAAELARNDIDTEASRSGRRVNEQMRLLEVFLKSGPASRGDLTVITTGRRDVEKK